MSIETLIKEDILGDVTNIVELMVQVDGTTEKDIKHYEFFHGCKSRYMKYVFYECEDKGPQIDNFIELSEESNDLELNKFIDHLI